MDCTCPTPAIVDVARWVGLVITVLGALSVSPSGTRAAFTTAWQHTTEAAKRAWRLLPWVRPAGGKTTHAVGATITIRSHATASALVGWAEEADVSHKLDILDQRTRQHDEEIGTLQRDLRQLRTDTESLVQAVGADCEAKTGEVHQRLDEMTLKATELDARALPVILLGIAFSGLGPDFVRLSVPVGGVILSVGLAWAIVACALIWHSPGSSA